MELAVLLAVALVISAIGFYKYVYFISLGYGFSIAGLGVALLILYRDSLTTGTVLASVLFVLYGIRLGGYLLIRELKSSSYNKHMKTEIKDGKDMKFLVKCAIWITCVLLYVFEVVPVFYRMQNGEADNWVLYVGIAIMVVGLVLETSADIQKNALKKQNPKRFCSTGLFKLVRCPNYLGEMLFWTGVFVSGFTALSGAWQWSLAVIGYVGIIYVMFSGARRLEIRQNKNYGADPEYQEYVKKTPIMVPFIPLYSVEKYKFLVG